MPPQNVAYVLHQDKVEVCELGTGGELVNCTDAGLSGHQRLYSFAISGSHAYMADWIDAQQRAMIIHCRIGADGAFSACAETGPAIAVFGMHIRGTTLYMGDYDSTAVHKCDIANDGSLGSCSEAGVLEAGAPSSGPVRIVGTTAYVLQYFGKVSKCAVEEDGSLSGCAGAGGADLDIANSFAISGSHMYILDGVTAAVIRCVIEADGSLNNCVIAGTPGIAPTQVAVRDSVIYITDADEAIGLMRCTADANGLFTGCESAPGRSLWDIAIIN